jgi:hypothetical protein
MSHGRDSRAVCAAFRQDQAGDSNYSNLDATNAAFGVEIAVDNLSAAEGTSPRSAEDIDAAVRGVAKACSDDGN